MLMYVTWLIFGVKELDNQPYTECLMTIEVGLSYSQMITYGKHA